MKKTLYLLPFLVIGALLFSSCKKNDGPAPEQPLDPGAGDQENVTRISLTIMDSITSLVSTVAYTDLKGDGNYTVDSLKLKPNTVYLAKLAIYDDTKTPVDTITHEIEEEANYHRFHYTLIPATGSSASIVTTLLDQDTKTPPQPLGLSFKIKTGTGSGLGNFNINLRHFDNGQEKNGDITGGEQDIYVNFPTVIR